MTNSKTASAALVARTERKESSMDTNRKTAIIVGVLYITGDVGAVLSLVLAGPFIGSLAKVAANQNQVAAGALLILVEGLALAMIPVLMYRMLKKYNQVLALGYIVFRGGLETFTYVASAVSWLLLVRLSQASVQGGAPDFQALGTLLQGNEIFSVTSIIFPLGALMFYYLLYQSRLIPRWISGLGIVGIVPYLAAALLVVFGVIGTFSTVDTVLSLPIGVQEVILAIWLIVKGFNPSAIATVNERETPSLTQRVAPVDEAEAPIAQGL